jgi:hypothetical protein
MARGVGNLSFPEATSATKVVFPIGFAPGAPGVGLSPQASRWVLTRLHARYGKDALGEDLVFRPATPIVGGREMRNEDGGALEQGSTPSQTNNFQARYVIRHPWTGAVACASPTRGVWGGKPGGGETPALAAQGIAFAQRGPAASIPASPAVATTGDAGTPGTSPTAPPKGRGCGGCSLATGGEGMVGIGVTGIVLALVATRRRRRPS